MDVRRNDRSWQRVIVREICNGFESSTSRRKTKFDRIDAISDVSYSSLTADVFFQNEHGERSTKKTVVEKKILLYLSTCLARSSVDSPLTRGATREKSTNADRTEIFNLSPPARDCRLDGVSDWWDTSLAMEIGLLRHLWFSAVCFVRHVTTDRDMFYACCREKFKKLEFIRVLIVSIDG